MWVLDGNNSLKCIKSIGNWKIGDTHTFEDSDYFLSTSFVDRFADEVKRRSSQPTEDSDDEGQNDEESRDPTDGSSDTTPSGCTDNWKAAASDEKKKMWAIFSEAGIFASACHHGLILWIADMVQSLSCTF